MTKLETHLHTVTLFVFLPSTAMAPQDTEAATTAAAAAKADKGKGKASEADASSSMADRKARLSALRSKMAESSRANRKDVLSEQSRTRGLAAARKEASAAHARKLADAEQTLEERDLREAGEDIERHRNFAYSIEDNDRWEDKLQEKERRRDKGVIGQYITQFHSACSRYQSLTSSFPINL